MVQLKADAEQIRQALKALEREPWLRSGERRWWPKFIFHHTDIRNAVGVLRDGCLYSRTRAEQLGKLAVSSGSTSILAGTNPEIKDCVRLYFRPKTPTQFYAEGIQSKDTLAQSRYPSAHCPVLIFFLFDSAQILTCADCRFSDQGLNNAGAAILSTAEELKNLPWQKIYHNTRFDRSRIEESDIARRRQAEIIVPRELKLDALKYIYCRSVAEKETLLHLLPVNSLFEYYLKTVATTRSTLFYRQHTFLDTVHLSSQSVTFNFSPDTESPGPFHLILELQDRSGHELLHREWSTFDANRSYRLQLPQALDEYTISLKLDGHLAYASRYESTDIPF